MEIHRLLDQEITTVKGIGPGRAKYLKKLGISSLYDLLFFYPRTYENAGRRASINELVEGEKYLVTGKITQLREERARRRRNLVITKAVLADETGELGLIWFQQHLPTPSPLYRQLEKNPTVSVYGKVESERGYLVMKSPELETAKLDESLNLGRITPVYPLTEGLNQRLLRRTIRTGLDQFLDKLVDPLPEEFRVSHGLISLHQALEALHFPPTAELAEAARERLAFDQLLAYALVLQQRRRDLKVLGISHQQPGRLVKEMLNSLPFQPTSAQERAARQIWQQMASDTQMEHLLMGDVGTGKTLVAALAIAKTIEDGHQAAFMAPTSILALQHFESLRGYLEGLGIQIRLLLGDTSEAEKAEIYQELATHQCDLVVGTHSLIQEGVAFADLGLAVTDEQHRFGVEQRRGLALKGEHPDLLILSATPIPRTLALAAYGELGYSLLDERPPGRQPIVTKWIRSSRLPKVWEFAQKEVAQGYAGYIICPLVEENSELSGVAGVVEYGQYLKNGPLRDINLALLHGGMSEEAKASVLQNFKEGRVDILVATTVVEIGVDVSRASFMVIMNAERFGLAQLHQLRGRVGRGSRKSYCILCSDRDGELAAQRLRTLEKVSDGGKIAEVDLSLRGPGEVFGLRQHGSEDLLFQTMQTHPELHQKAFALAEKIADQPWEQKYPELARYVHNCFKSLGPGVEGGFSG